MSSGGYSDRLLANTQRDFSEMVFLECRVCRSRLLERKDAVEMHFEWASLDQFIQPIDRFAATFAIICIDAHSMGRLRRGHHTVWISNPAIKSNRRKRSISSFTTGGDKRGVDPIGCKFTSDIQHVVTTTVDCSIRAETFDKGHSIFA